MCACLCHVMDWYSIQGVSGIVPRVSRDRLGTSCTSVQNKLEVSIVNSFYKEIVLPVFYFTCMIKES